MGFSIALACTDVYRARYSLASAYHRPSTSRRSFLAAPLQSTPIRCGWKPHLPGLVEFSAVGKGSLSPSLSGRLIAPTGPFTGKRLHVSQSVQLFETGLHGHPPSLSGSCRVHGHFPQILAA